MVCISVLSPILLRIGCRRMQPVQLDKRPTGLTPTHALETGLPVSALLGTLLLCWYSPLSDVLQSDVAWGQVIICHFIVLFFGCPIHMLTLPKKQVVPMFLICPPALAATLACILRGFRRKQTIGSCVLLTTAMVVRRQAYLSHLGSKEEWAMLFITVVMIITATARSVYHRETVASDEWSYAEMRAQLPRHAKVAAVEDSNESTTAASPYAVEIDE